MSTTEELARRLESHAATREFMGVPSTHLRDAATRLRKLEAERDRYKGYGSLDIDRLLKERDRLRAALLSAPDPTPEHGLHSDCLESSYTDWYRANVEPLK